MDITPISALGSNAWKCAPKKNRVWLVVLRFLMRKRIGTHFCALLRPYCNNYLMIGFPKIPWMWMFFIENNWLG